MELRKGKMKSRELAQWFKVSYNTYKNKIPRYLDQLSYYCEFEPIYGGVDIKEVHLPIYKKNYKEDSIKEYMTEYHKTGGLMTMTGIAEHTSLSVYTATKIRNELFGDKPINIDKNAKGVLGYRERIWAIKLGTNSYRHFTKEEQELFDLLINQEYIGKMTPEAIKDRELLLKCCAEAGMSAEEYQQEIANHKLDFFNNVIQKFKSLTGCQIGSPTQHTMIIEFEVEDEYRDFLFKLIDDLRTAAI